MQEFKVGDKVLVEARIGSVCRDNAYYVSLKDFSGQLFYIDKVYPIPIKTYEDGLAEAWETARRLNAVDRFMEMSTDDFDKLFGNRTLNEVFNDFSPQEAAAKIRAWKDVHDIHVGDIIETAEGLFVITYIEGDAGYIMTCDGKCRLLTNKFQKTGRHIDIAGLLAEIGGVE